MYLRNSIVLMKLLVSFSGSAPARGFSNLPSSLDDTMELELSCKPSFVLLLKKSKSLEFRRHVMLQHKAIH